MSIRSVWWVVVALVAASGGCGGCGDDGDDGQPTDDYTHETVGARCIQSLPVTQLYPGGDNPDDLLANNAPGGAIAVVAHAGTISHDGGRTLTKLLASSTEGGVPRLDAINVEYPVVASSDFYVTGRSNAPCLGTGELQLVIVVDGIGHATCPTRDALTLSGGAVADAVYKPDGTRWLARSNELLYASRDGGGSWRVVGPTPFFISEFFSFTPLAFATDRAFFVTQQDPVTLLAVAGQPVRKVQWQAATGSSAVPQSAVFWRGAIVGAIGGDVYATSDEGATYDQVETPPNALYLNLVVDAQDRLWGFPASYFCIRQDESMPCPATGYRWDSLGAKPVKIDVDFGGLPDSNFHNVFASGDHFKALLETDGAQPEVLRHLICDVGTGITGEYEPIQVSTVEDAAVSASILRVDRFDAATHYYEHMAVAPSGRIYANSGQDSGFRTGTQAFESLLNHTNDPVQLVRAPFAASDLGVGISQVTKDTGSVPFASHRIGRLSNQAAGTFVEGPVDWAPAGHPEAGLQTVREYPGVQLGTTNNGVTYRLDHSTYQTTNPIELAPPTWENQAVMNHLHGAFVGGLAYEYPNEDSARQYIVRFDPRRDPVPTKFGVDAKCYVATPAPECIPFDNAAARAALFDADGNLYVLDTNRGSVFELPATGTALVEVATGFLHPNDLAIRTVNGKAVVLVLDGDVFAFVPQPGVTKHHGPPPPPDHEAVFADRDVRGCLRTTGPCLDTPMVALSDGTVPGRVDLTTGTGCFTGMRTGDTAGTIVATGGTLAVTSWASGSICVTAPPGTRNGLLHVIVDGVESNRLAYEVKATVTGQTPGRLRANAIMRITGTNLEHVTTSGTVVARGDTFLDVRPDFGNIDLLQRAVTFSTVTFPTDGDIIRGCTAGPGQLCDLLTEGVFSPQITVDGTPVALIPSFGTHVAFVVPAGLSPGSHAIIVTSSSGIGPATGTLVVPALAPDPLATGITPGSLDPRLGWPAVISGPDSASHVFAPLFRANLIVNGGVEYPQGALVAFTGSGWRSASPSTGVEQSLGSADKYIALGALGTNLLVVSHDRVLQVTPAAANATTPYTMTPLATLAVSQTSEAIVVGSIAGHGVVVEADNAMTTRFFDVPAAGGTNIAPTLTQTTLARLGQHAVIAPTGIYLGTCGEPAQTASIIVIPVTGGGPSPLVFGAAQMVVTNNTAHVLACTATTDGYAYVLREADGTERVYKHTIVGGTTLFATIPASVPHGDLAAMRPALVDLAPTPAGDFAILAMPSTTELRLYHLTAAGTATAGIPLAPLAQLRPGQRCFGTAKTNCGTDSLGRPYLPGSDGCAPSACPVKTFTLESAAVNVFGRAMIVPGSVGTTAQVIYEVGGGAYSPNHLGTTADIHRVTFPVP